MTKPGRLMFALLILLAVALPLISCAAESNLRETAGTIRLSTDDRMELSLDQSDGKAKRLRIGGASFPLYAPLIRFEEVIEDPDAPDLLAGNWSVPDASIEESANGHPGKWMRVSGEDEVRPKTQVQVNQTEAQPLVLSGWCQAHLEGEALGWINRNLALNANVSHSDGSKMPEVSAYFGQYDHSPQFNKRIICPDRPLKSVDLDLSVPGGKCTAWYRDVKLQPADYRISSPVGSLRRIDGSVLQEFEIAPSSLKGLVTYRPKPDCIEVGCSFESTQPVDRAISGYVAIPFDAIGGVWWDDMRTKRKIEPGMLYRAGKWYGAGRDGYNSRYPIACIETAKGVGLALGTSVAEPRVFQTEYDAERKELRIRFDIGMSPNAGLWANKGSFTAYLFTYMDGFRGATEKYQRIFGWAFENRVEKQGIWLPFMTPPAIVEHEDFHFAFLESVGHMGWDERQGMYAFQYVEPWIHHQEIGDEVHGAVVPQRSVDLAKRIVNEDDRSLPLDIRRRYPAYLGSYIEDQWTHPQGYFFRSPQGRNENMMIVNPNASGWDREVIRETMAVSRQWDLPGWTFARVSAHPFLEVDTEQKASGKQSVRFDPIEGKSQYEQYLRGISQIIRYEGESLGPFTLSYSARGEDMPIGGTGFRWRVTFWFEEGTSKAESLAIEDLSGEWKKSTHSITLDRLPKFVSVSLDTPALTPDSTILWLDDVSLDVGGRNFLANGGFEEAELLPCRLDGVYLDTMECYEANLNYRRAHWLHTEEPLTFDSARNPAMQQVFSHISFAKHIAEWMHSGDRLTFGNCVPVTPFAAPYLDVMGTEFFWKPGGTWSPWPDSEFNFARFMSRGKPYCALQYSDLTVDEETRYVKRCLFYGVFPSNQGAPSGGWYWADPIVVNRHRPVFAKYVPTIIEVAEAGWQPVTLARTDDPDVWIERFGDGKTLYLTVFNPSATRKTVTVTLDPRSEVTLRSGLTDVLTGKSVRWKPRTASFEVGLDAEDVAVYRIGGRP